MCDDEKVSFDLDKWADRLKDIDDQAKALRSLCNLSPKKRRGRMSKIQYDEAIRLSRERDEIEQFCSKPSNKEQTNISYPTYEQYIETFDI